MKVGRLASLAYALPEKVSEMAKIPLLATQLARFPKTACGHLIGLLLSLDWRNIPQVSMVDNREPVAVGSA